MYGGSSRQRGEALNNSAGGSPNAGVLAPARVEP